MIRLPLRYVVLHHTGVAAPHYDLMFESVSGGELVTYRSNQWPVDPAEPLTCRLPDHRRKYLEYEGEISGGRGWVKRIATGWCAQVADGKSKILLLDSGQRLRLADASSTEAGA